MGGTHGIPGWALGDSWPLGNEWPLGTRALGPAYFICKSDLVFFIIILYAGPSNKNANHAIREIFTWIKSWGVFSVERVAGRVPLVPGPDQVLRHLGEAGVDANSTPRPWQTFHRRGYNGW